MTDEERKDEIEQKMVELIDLIPDKGYLTITGFEGDQLTVMNQKQVCIYNEYVTIQSSKIKG